MLYTPVKVSVANGQHEKLKDAIGGQKAVSIKIDLRNVGGEGGERDTLLLTRGQVAKIEKAKMTRRSSKVIRLSRKQVQMNVSHTGGYLGLLTGMIAKVLPTLAKGVATSLVSNAVNKAISGSGDGLYLFKSGHCIKVDPVKGNGLYLQHHHKTTDNVGGDGLYLKRGSLIQSGEGLIFGSDSILEKIPILEDLLGWLL